MTPEGEPKLLDFGIAKLLETPTGPPGAEPTLTLGGAMTPEYASPEQLRGEPITTASDVYSLGVVFYELLSGQRPYRFPSRRPEDMARVICEQEPERLSSAAARAGNDLAARRRAAGCRATWTTSPRWPCARNPRDATAASRSSPRTSAATARNCR